MSFKEAISSVFSNYANFNGRARRSEYWYFAVFSSLVSAIFTALGNLTDGSMIITALQGLFSLAILIPSLAVAWRRLHDIGKSGAWYFIALVPVVGWILLLVWFLKDSEPGENQYGPNPKETVDVY